MHAINQIWGYNAIQAIAQTLAMHTLQDACNLWKSGTAF